MATLSPLTPCLWFDSQAEEAAQFYTSVFPNSKITTIQRYTDAGQEIHGQAEGKVMVAAFELNGQPFVALNGGPQFQFSEAVSFQIHCDSQEEVDYYWNKLSEGGDESAQQCGWLKDVYGLSWQVIPNRLLELIQHPDAEVAQRVTNTMLQMKKFDIAELERVAAA